MTFLILITFNGQNKPLVIGAIGSTKRKTSLMKLEKEGYFFDTLIHPSVIKSRWVKIGEGSIVTPGVIMTCQIEIGRHVILNLGTQIGHDVRIGDYVYTFSRSKGNGSCQSGG